MSNHDFSDEQLQRDILAKHNCSLRTIEPHADILWLQSWVLDEPRGSILFRNMPEADVRKCVAIYVFLYYEKGVEYSLASTCARGCVGHIITNQELLAEWDAGEPGIEARKALKETWAETEARWNKRHEHA